MNRHPFSLDRDDTIAVFVDLQERFAPTIADMEEVLAGASVLARATRRLALPFLVTEQYPKGLGPTLPPVADYLLGGGPGQRRPIEKTAFSCCGEPAFLDALESSGRRSVVLCGIETHVCVLQTALDLLARDFGVWIVADAVGSRAPANRDLALRQLDAAGAVVTSVETALFQLLGDAKAPDFRDVQALVV